MYLQNCLLTSYNHYIGEEGLIQGVIKIIDMISV